MHHTCQQRLANHPCFNVEASASWGRIHLPIAPNCNLQCNFCNRKYDCVNENRPGVTQQVYTPTEAMAVLDQLFKQRSDISVVGIAGPGDPLCEPKNTLATLQAVHERYPDLMAITVAKHHIVIYQCLQHLRMSTDTIIVLKKYHDDPGRAAV